MKLFLLFAIIFTGCTSFSMATDKRLTVEQCIQQQVELYSDLCAEESSGYEEMDGPDAHFAGVKCATQAALWCIEDLRLSPLPVVNK